MPELIRSTYQVFPYPTELAPDAVYLAAYCVFFLLAVFRLRTAPALGWLLLFTTMRIVAFAIRVYMHDHSYSEATFRAMQAMLALGLPVLLETILTLVGEHFATAHDLGYRRHRTFTHLLSLILIGDIIAGILYATWVGEKSIGDTVQAYIILQFVFLALLILHQLFRMRHLCFATGIFLLALTAILLVPPIYLELLYLGDTDWIRDDITAFYVLWCMPEALVVLGLLIVPIYTWYPNYRSSLIY